MSEVKMRRRVYSVRDDRMKTYGQLVFIENDSVASRAFGDLVLSDNKSLMATHPADFSLWYLGEFDAETGIFSCEEKPYIIARASDFVNPNKE